MPAVSYERGCQGTPLLRLLCTFHLWLLLTSWSEPEHWLAVTVQRQSMPKRKHAERQKYILYERFNIFSFRIVTIVIGCGVKKKRCRGWGAAPDSLKLERCKVCRAFSALAPSIGSHSV